MVAGAATGLLVGLTGIGGGSLMTPLLLLFFGVAPMVAVGTDLLFAAVTKTFAAVPHNSKKLIDWQVVKRLWLGSLPSSALLIAFVHRTAVDPQLASLLKSVIAAAVMVTATGMLFHGPLHRLGQRLRYSSTAAFKKLQAPLTVVLGAVLGVLVTLTSIGAGALGVVFLVYLYPVRLTPPRLIATDNVHAIPLALFAGLGHLAIGNVDFALLANMLAGSIPAVIVGALLSSWLPHRVLRVALVVLLMTVGIKLWFS